MSIEAVALFGNATVPVLGWLLRAWPFVPRAQRVECLRHLWMHGRTGLFDSARLQEMLQLFRQTSGLREALPRRRTFSLYRGVAAESETQARIKMRRPAWTGSRQMAVFFAARSSRPSVAYVGEIIVRRSDVLAYFTDREESEFVLDPTRLDDHAIRVTRVSPEEAKRVLSAHERESRSRLEAATTRKVLKD